jgi:hypothetical protein
LVLLVCHIFFPEIKHFLSIEMPASSKHLDNDKKATKAVGEKASGLMDGIVTGLPKRVSPAIVDGIIRGVPKGMGSRGMSSVSASSTTNSKGSFGAGNFAEGAR